MSAEAYQSTREKLARARAGDDAARDEVVAENLALVRHLVRRYMNRGAEYEDLFQYGCMGLVKAVDRFDPDYPVQFSTYAVPVILGEIRRYLRDDGPVHVSRTIRERARDVGAFIGDFTQAHDREPDVGEIADGLNMERGDVLMALNSRQRVRSLNEPVGAAGELRLMDVLGEEQMADVDARLTLKKLLGDLPKEDRALIVRRYFLRHTQTRIAMDTGSTQVQVSRRESRILKRMREMAESEMM